MTWRRFLSRSAIAMDVECAEVASISAALRRIEAELERMAIDVAALHEKLEPEIRFTVGPVSNKE